MADTIDFRPFNSKVDELINALNKNTEVKTGGADKLAAEEKGIINNLKKIGTVAFEVSEELASAGRGLARTIGTTLADGIRLEAGARANFASQITRYGVNLAATVDQIQAVQKSAADAFVNVPEGFQLSSDATAEFASQLKKIVRINI
jgi:pyridoxine 5'-phosphate synthase PdxJ